MITTAFRVSQFIAFCALLYFGLYRAAMACSNADNARYRVAHDGKSWREYQEDQERNYREHALGEEHSNGYYCEEYANNMFWVTKVCYPIIKPATPPTDTFNGVN